MRAAALFIFLLSFAGCSLDRSGIVGPPPDGARIDGGGAIVDGGRGVDAGRDRDAGRGRDGGRDRDAGRERDAGNDAGRAPSCGDIFAGVKGYTTVCTEDATRCAMIFDRGGGLGSNTRSCNATCAEVGWDCGGSGPAGAGDGCATITSTDCSTSYNHMLCLCDRP